MSVRKRSSSPDLVGNPSPYHPSVTLFVSATSDNYGEQSGLPRPSPRRSKRIKSIKSEDDATIDGVDAPALPTHSHIPNSKRKGPAKRPPNSHASTSSGSKRKPASSSRKAKPIPQTLETPHPSPERWREAFDAIKEMRSRIVAPVDTMGAGAAQLGETIPENKRFSTLVSLMLSSQTKDEVTSAAVRSLRAAVGGSLSVDAILKSDEKTISDAICKVGFWRRKTDYIKRTAQRLHDEFNSDVPRTVDELCSLPGVGPKMAFLALHVAWKVNAGIGVDVHVHRITNRLGWHNPPSKTPEETRLNLQSWVPMDLRPTFTGLFVGFGQTICLPVNPRCDSCTLSNDLCPSARQIGTSGVNNTGVMPLGSPGPKVKIEIASEDTENAPEHA